MFIIPYSTPQNEGVRSVAFKEVPAASNPRLKNAKLMRRNERANVLPCLYKRERRNREAPAPNRDRNSISLREVVTDTPEREERGREGRGGRGGERMEQNKREKEGREGRERRKGRYREGRRDKLQ